MPGTGESLSAYVRRLLGGLLGVLPGDLAATDTFESLGLERLDLFEIADEIEFRTGVVVPDVAFSSFHTVGDFERDLCSRLQAAFPRG